MRRRQFVLSASAAAAASCSRPPRAPVSSAGLRTGGSRMIPIDGGKYRAWTKRAGESDIKVLLLHGGPGFNHMYLECMEDFLPQAGIEFYYYDQLGSTFSDNPDDNSLWTIERFRDEAEQVRQGLGLEQFYLYGHSWGGMLAYEYALKYGTHLKGLVISDMVASIPYYVQYVNKLRQQFPPDAVATLQKYEAKSDFEAPEYQKIIFDQLYTKHLCRLNPWPEPVDRAFKFVNQKIYNYMQGPNEFVISGTMKNWDRTRDLKDIRPRTLVMGARYDTMDPLEMQRIAQAMPNARAVISERGSHLALYDDQDWYFGELIRFLKQV
ncbi:MAG: proline iminopeptidase [Terriglobia bacterium]|nr:MAG: proline iminopeptidase [Terriglobia bacterium]